jgi:hypothetical protein
MSVFTSSVRVPPYSQREFTSVQGALPSVSTSDCQSTGMRPQPAGFNRRFSAFFREYWRRIKVMNAAFAHAQSGDGAGSRARSEERLRDEEAWSRIDNEGCPHDSPRQP